MTGLTINGRYEVLERLGEGAVFQSSKCREISTGRILSVKRFASGFSDADSAAKVLMAEAPLLRELNHVNIAHLEDVSVEAGQPLLITEYVRGVDLKERQRRITVFTPSAAIEFCLAICEALSAGHQKGIVHGDLKPQNVIVTPEGQIKVTDFGLYRVVAASAGAAKSALIQSAPYRAPELTTSGTPTPSSDIYAVGCLLYEMLTGSPPFMGDTPDSVFEKHRNETPNSPKAVNPGIPRAVDGIILKCIMKRPDQRYRTVSDVIGDLKVVRDALRFGRSLSWSPLDNIEGAPGTADPAAATRVTARDIPSVSAKPSGKERTRAVPPSNVPDDRIPLFIKIALGAVIFVLVITAVAASALWMAAMAKPADEVLPQLKGLNIDNARAAANKAHVHLNPHEEYDDQPPGTVYRVEPDDLAGKHVKIGRTINVWVSKGSRYVDVPDVVGLHKDEAERKLKEAGLGLGNVVRKFHRTVELDHVIEQGSKSRKRVSRDSSVDLSISDGIDPSNPDSGNSGNDSATGGADSGTTQNGGNTDSANTGKDNRKTNSTNSDRANNGTGDQPEPVTVKLTKKVPKDGKGSRRVRIEYDDLQGTHVALDEFHDEGTLVETRAMVTGEKIRVRVYFGDDTKPIDQISQTVKKKVSP